MMNIFRETNENWNKRLKGLLLKMKKIVLIFLVFSIISCAKEKDTITSNKGNNNSLVVNQKKLQEIKNIKVATISFLAGSKANI